MVFMTVVTNLEYATSIGINLEHLNHMYGTCSLSMVSILAF